MTQQLEDENARLRIKLAIAEARDGGYYKSTPLGLLRVESQADQRILNECGANVVQYCADSITLEHRAKPGQWPKKAPWEQFTISHGAWVWLRGLLQELIELRKFKRGRA